MYPYNKIYSILESALREKYPGKDGYGCQYYIGNVWTDKALLQKGYYAEEGAPTLSLITFSVTPGDQQNSPLITLTGDPMAVQIQAVPKDGGDAMILDESIHSSFKEAGKRNASDDSKSMNAVMRMLMGLMDDDDFDEETMNHWRERYDRKSKKPIKKNEAVESTEDTVVEGWSSLSGETITENFTTSLEESSFDEKKLIIKNVKMLGASSVNGRDYPETTQREAIPLFEGAKAYLNHAKKKDSEEPRQVQEQIGYYKNVTVRNGGTYGDLHLVDKPIVREEVIPYADKSVAHLVGNSIVARAQMSKQKNGRMLVEKILAARSVDLVAEPATTTSLYEGKTITESLDATKETQMEFKDLTLESLKKERPELLEAVLVLNKEKEQQRVTALESEVTALKDEVKARDEKLVAKDAELKAKDDVIKEAEKKQLERDAANEIERLRNGRVTRYVKMDAQGGTA